MIEFFLHYTNQAFAGHQECAIDGLEDENNFIQLLFVADLNRDHHLDLIWKHFSNDQMDIAYGYGNGSFQQAISFSTAKQSYGTEVVLGDLNNDTYPDLVLALLAEQQIVVHLARRDASFLTVPDRRVTIRMHAASLALADFNSDGILDLAYGAEDGMFSILLGVGDGSFHLEHNYSTPSERALEKTIPCDLNGDGLTDLVFSHSDKTRLAVMLNDGSRKFRSVAFPYEDKFYTNQIEIGYLDRDRHLDMAAVLGFGEKIHIYFGSGNGSFTRSETSIVVEDRQFKYLEMADFNRDQRLDLVTVVDGDLAILLNDC